MIPTITDDQRKQFAEDGYFLLENVFTTAEMEELATVIEAYQKGHEERLKASGSNDGISRASEISFTDHLAEKDDTLRAFATRPEFVALSTQMLGPDTDLYWNQAVFKQPEGEKEFPWHHNLDPPHQADWLGVVRALIEKGKTVVSVLHDSETKTFVAAHPFGPSGD